MKPEQWIIALLVCLMVLLMTTRSCKDVETIPPEVIKSLNDSIAKLHTAILAEHMKQVRMQLMIDSLDTVKKLVYIKYRDKQSEILTLPIDSIDSLIRAGIRDSR